MPISFITASGVAPEAGVGRLEAERPDDSPVQSTFCTWLNRRQITRGSHDLD
jgi:hypothetical protein